MPDLGDALVQIAGVVKTYGATRAVDDVSLDLQSGRFVTLLALAGAARRRCSV